MIQTWYVSDSNHLFLTKMDEVVMLRVLIMVLLLDSISQSRASAVDVRLWRTLRFSDHHPQ